MTIWYIVYSFGTFSGFGIMYREKSGNPEPEVIKLISFKKTFPSLRRISTWREIVRSHTGNNILSETQQFFLKFLMDNPSFRQGRFYWLLDKFSYNLTVIQKAACVYCFSMIAKYLLAKNKYICRTERQTFNDFSLFSAKNGFFLKIQSYD
jgi:hypothetical protein